MVARVSYNPLCRKGYHIFEILFLLTLGGTRLLLLLLFIFIFAVIVSLSIKIDNNSKSGVAPVPFLFRRTLKSIGTDQ